MVFLWFNFIPDFCIFLLKKKKKGGGGGGRDDYGLWDSVHRAQFLFNYSRLLFFFFFICESKKEMVGQSRSLTVTFSSLALEEYVRS